LPRRAYPHAVELPDVAHDAVTVDVYRVPVLVCLPEWLLRAVRAPRPYGLIANALLPCLAVRYRLFAPTHLRSPFTHFTVAGCTRSGLVTRLRLRSTRLACLGCLYFLPGLRLTRGLPRVACNTFGCALPADTFTHPADFLAVRLLLAAHYAAPGYLTLLLVVSRLGSRYTPANTPVAFAPHCVRFSQRTRAVYTHTHGFNVCGCLPHDSPVVAVAARSAFTFTYDADGCPGLLLQLRLI